LAGCPLGPEVVGVGGVVGVGCAVGRVGSVGVGEGEVCGCDAGVEDAGSCATTAIVIKVSKLRETSDLRKDIEHPTEPGRLERLYPRLHAGTRERLPLTLTLCKGPKIPFIFGKSTFTAAAKALDALQVVPWRYGVVCDSLGTGGGASPLASRHRTAFSFLASAASGREKFICEDSFAPGAFFSFTL